MQPGPSPLLQAWLSFPLEPQRASRKKGLQGGASPLLLPGQVSRRHCQNSDYSSDGQVLGSSGSLDLDLGSLMPSDAVLKQSEFLEPLDDDTKDLYRRILEAE